MASQGKSNRTQELLYSCDSREELCERIATLEELAQDMYGYASNREIELCNACTEADGDYSDCGACDEYDGACGIAKKRFEDLYFDRIREMGIEVQE